MMKTRLSLALAVLALGAGACAKTDDAPGKEPALEIAAQPAETAAVDAAATASAQPSAGTPPLSAYVGKSPFEPVQGVAFFANPTVRAAITASGAGREILDFVFRDANVVGGIRETRERLLTSGHDPAGAGVTNWAVLVTPDGKAAVCYSEGADPNAISSDWYYGGEKVFSIDDRCPTRGEDIESFSNWPIGPIPG